MKFLSAAIPNQIILDVKVKNEIISPSAAIMGRLILDGVHLSDVGITVDESTTYFITVPPIPVGLGEVKNLRVQAQAPTPIGMFNYNSVYHIIDYSDIPVDYDAVRSKLGVIESEVFDYELNLETTYLNSFKIFSPKFFLDRATIPNINYMYGRYLVLASAISTVPTLLLRIAKTDKTENGSFTRLANANNLKDLTDALTGELLDILDLLDEYTVNDTTSSAIFEFITISPDLVTGT